MALTDTFIKQVKHTENPTGDKYRDGDGMYLHVKAAGKYWRMDYRFGGKRKTLALGTYPEVSLAKARQRRERAREQLAEGMNPSDEKRREKLIAISTAVNTFEVVAREWLSKTSATRAESTTRKVTNWLEHDIFPWLGRMPIGAIGPRDVLAVLRKMEARGALDSVHRLKQVCGQVFRYAIASGSAERDVTQDLKGALAKSVPTNFAAITEPKKVGDLMRSIFDYGGHPYTVAALKLAPLVFVRPGELRTAEWTEIHLDGAEWRIPGDKMKIESCSSSLDLVFP